MCGGSLTRVWSRKYTIYQGPAKYLTEHSLTRDQDDDAVSTEESIWDLTMDINLKGMRPFLLMSDPHLTTQCAGVWFGCKYGIPALRRAGGGSIINTASFVAKMGAATPQIACMLNSLLVCKRGP